MSDARKKIDIHNLLTVIATIAQEQVNVSELVTLTGLSRPTLRRLIASARSLLQVDIIYVPGQHGTGGYYVITDWGYFEGRRVTNDYTIG